MLIKGYWIKEYDFADSEGLEEKWQRSPKSLS